MGHPVRLSPPLALVSVCGFVAWLTHPPSHPPERPPTILKSPRVCFFPCLHMAAQATRSQPAAQHCVSCAAQTHLAEYEGSCILSTHYYRHHHHCYSSLVRHHRAEFVVRLWGAYFDVSSIKSNTRGASSSKVDTAAFEPLVQWDIDLYGLEFFRAKVRQWCGMW